MPRLYSEGLRKLASCIHWNYVCLAMGCILLTIPAGFVALDLRNSKGVSIARFFVQNCVAHAATVLLPTGAKVSEIIILTATSVFFPYYGAGRAFQYLMQWMECHRDHVHQALAREALVVLARTSTWEPTSEPGQWDEVYVDEGDLESSAIDDHAENDEVPLEVEGATDKSSGNKAQLRLSAEFWERLYVAKPIQLENRAYQGHIKFPLPHGYETIILPLFSGVQMINSELEPTTDIKLSYSLTVLKIGISVFQLISAGYSLYSTRGDQVRLFGAAAYGFIVIPYLLMSLLNLGTTLLVPDFPTLYLLQSRILLEASRRSETVIRHAVGTLSSEPIDIPHGRCKVYMRVEMSQQRRLLIKTTMDGDVTAYNLISGVDTLEHEARTFRFSRYTDTPITYLTSSVMRNMRTEPHSEEEDTTWFIAWSPPARPTGRRGALEPTMRLLESAPDGYEDSSFWNVQSVVSIILIALPILIDYAISHFARGQAAKWQLAVLIIWFIYNACSFASQKLLRIHPPSTLIASSLFGIPAFAACVVMMMQDPGLGTSSSP